MDYSILITFLKDKENITDLEKDILDTWNELQKNPFDRNSAQLQILQNNAKYPDIFIAIGAMPVPSRFMRKIICRLRLNEVSRQ